MSKQTYLFNRSVNPLLSPNFGRGNPRRNAMKLKAAQIIQSSWDFIRSIDKEIAAKRELLYASAE